MTSTILETGRSAGNVTKSFGQPALKFSPVGDGFRKIAIALSVLLFCGTAYARGFRKPKGTTAQRVSQTGGANSESASTGAVNKPASDNYVIGPADVLVISVWKQPDISRTVPVLPDGTISLPLIGQVTASGLTSGKLHDIIAERLKKYMADPRVNVSVEEVKSQSFNILGKVLKPGSYALGKPLTVLDAIALAGGFQDFAKVNKIYILRRIPDGAQKMLPFNYKAVIKGKRADENLRLTAGDTIIVP